MRLKEQLLQQEKQLVESQNRWLSAELETKSTQLLEVKKEKVNTVCELENKLSSSEDKVHVHDYACVCVCVRQMKDRKWIDTCRSY